MASNPTTIGKLRKQGLGDNLNTWGLSGGLNGNFDLLDDAVWGVEVIALSGDRTLTSANYAAGNEIAPRVHRLTDGGLAAAPTITVPATANWWFVNNETAYAVSYSNGANSALVSANREGLVWTDGTSVYAKTFLDQADADNVTDALPYVFSTTTADSDPGAGKLRLDNPTQNAATTLYIDDQDSNAADLTSLIATWDDSTSPVKGTLWLRVQSDPKKFLTFNLTGVMAAGGYTKLTVSALASSAASPFVNGDALYVAFTASGSQGDAGSITNAGDGSVAAPGFAFAADPDTGAYRSGDGEVSFASNGTQVAAFSSTGLDMKGKAITNADEPVAFFFGCVM